MTIDPVNYTLCHGDRRIKLTPRAFDLLTYLHQCRGRLVSKQELLECVWPTQFVTEGVIKVVIHEIRKALNDDAVAPRFIETVHCRGYRFIGQLYLAHTGSGIAAANSLPAECG